jgi:succinate dehydrogenase hydrophobic anchor subunit
MNEAKSSGLKASETLPRSYERRFQSYRGTWAWLIQRLSAIGLFLLIPIKIYTGWAARGKVPYPEIWMSPWKLHFNSALQTWLDIAMLLFFLLHAFYGLRVILIDVGVLREDRWFWRMLALALALFFFTVWFVYIHEY